MGNVVEVHDTGVGIDFNGSGKCDLMCMNCHTEHHYPESLLV